MPAWIDKLHNALPNIDEDIVNHDIIGTYCPGQIFGSGAPQQDEKPVQCRICRECWNSNCNCCPEEDDE